MKTIQYALLLPKEQPERADIALQLEDVTAHDLEQLISELQALREQMQPGVPNDPASKASKRALLDPRFWVEHDLMRGHTLLGLRHPGSGWLWASIPEASRHRLAELLERSAGMSTQNPHQPRH